MEDTHFVTIDTSIGSLSLSWAGERIRRLYLPDDIRDTHPSSGDPEEPRPAWVNETIASLVRYAKGEDMFFAMDRLDLDSCSSFQCEVLLREHAVPRGWVTTYGRIARMLGAAGGARAVGRALATNPFPILIPCHRAVRADGSLGGYRGGVEMKRRLLTMEGVVFTSVGRVSMKRVYY
jgi:methylated-DNA-[protein]-cysteine S-methyltransferase